MEIPEPPSLLLCEVAYLRYEARAALPPLPLAGSGSQGKGGSHMFPSLVERSGTGEGKGVGADCVRTGTWFTLRPGTSFTFLDSF